MEKEKRTLSKSDFEFIQMNEKIFDKKFETKAVGYFGDAFRRFCKNKSSVVAFCILMFIILMAILVPAFTKDKDGRYSWNEEYVDPSTYQDPTKILLPPRIPLLEKLGIADGTRKFKEVNVAFIISITDEKVNELTNDAGNQELYIGNYFFLEYITNFDSLEEINAASYVTEFKGVKTTRVDIEYDMYAALTRPTWRKGIEYKQYLAYQEEGVIKLDAEGNELIEINKDAGKNSLITFVRNYNRTYKTNYKWNDEGVEELYFQETGKHIEEMYNYSVFVDLTQSPNFKETYHFFGTDSSGRDVWVRLWKGTRLSLLIGLFVAVVSITVGVIWGSISGYYGGVVDLAMERFTEILTGIPWIVIMTITKMLLRGHIDDTLIVAISLVLTSWTGTAGMVRSQMYRYKNREYVLASRTLGAKDLRLIFKHILPNALGTIVTSCVLVIPSAIFFESSVAYLGLGIDSTTISIGNLLNAGRDVGIVQYPYLTLFPALLISLLMISFNMFGNGLRDALNPSLRGSE